MRWRNKDYKREGRFFFENPSDSENMVTIYPTEKPGLRIAVTDVQADGSYNVSRECEIWLDEEAAKRLRDYLAAELDP